MPPREDPAERTGYLRFFYRGWRPTRLGRIWSGAWAWVSGLGLTSGNSAHFASQRPDQRSPPRNRPRRRQTPRPALSRLDAGGRFGVGAKRARGGRKGVYQAWSGASGYAYGDPASRARANPQGMVPGSHEWPSAPPGLAPGTHLSLRSNCKRLPCVSHRPCRLTNSPSARPGMPDRMPNPSFWHRASKSSIIRR